MAYQFLYRGFTIMSPPLSFQAKHIGKNASGGRRLHAVFALDLQPGNQRPGYLDIQRPVDALRLDTREPRTSGLGRPCPQFPCSPSVDSVLFVFECQRRSINQWFEHAPAKNCKVNLAVVPIRAALNVNGFRRYLDFYRKKDARTSGYGWLHYGQSTGEPGAKLPS